MENASKKRTENERRLSVPKKDNIPAPRKETKPPKLTERGTTRSRRRELGSPQRKTAKSKHQCKLNEPKKSGREKKRRSKTVWGGASELKVNHTSNNGEIKKTHDDNMATGKNGNETNKVNVQIAGSVKNQATNGKGHRSKRMGGPPRTKGTRRKREAVTKPDIKKNATRII